MKKSIQLFKTHVFITVKATVCICMYVYTYTYICVRIHVYTHVHTHVGPENTRFYSYPEGGSNP